MRWERVQVNSRARETPDGRKSAGRKGGIWGPGRRWGHTCNSIKGGRFLYVFGGYGKDNCQTNDVHVFDTAKLTWSKPMMKGVPPSPRDSHTCTTVGNKLFVFGGTDGKNPLKDLHVLDTSSNTWIVPSIHGKGPDAREGHGAALVDKRLFIFGGCGKSEENPEEIYYDDLYILDTENFVWEHAITSGTPPCARDSHTCSSWKNKLIVLGGEDASDYYLSDVHILDADTLVWKELSTSGQMLAPRAGHSAVALGRNLFVFGGFTDHKSLYDDLHVLNMDTGMWNRVTNVNQGPSARFSAAGDCLDGTNGILVFIGGCNGQLEALDDMYYLHTDIRVENGKVDGRQEKLSFRKELKRKCQDSRSKNDNDVHQLGTMSDSCQAGTLSGCSMLGEGKTFQARVINESSQGYAIKTVIDGNLFHGILFSFSTSPGHATHTKERKRMGLDANRYHPRSKTVKGSHQATKCPDQGLTNQIHSKESAMQELHGETLGFDSVNSAPSIDVYQSHMGSENVKASQVDMKDEGPGCRHKPIKEDACKNSCTISKETVLKMPNEESSTKKHGN